MVNLPMQAKVLVARRRSRSKIPRQYRSDYIPVPTQGLDRTHKESVDLVGNHRAKSGIPMMFLKGSVDYNAAKKLARAAYIEAMFPSMFGHLTNKPRREALVTRMKLLKTVEEILCDDPIERHVVLSRSWCHKEMLLCTDKGAYYLVKCDYLKSTITRSHNYPSREVVLAYRTRSPGILWRDPVPLDTA